MQVSELRLGRGRVDLAHVAALVLLVHRRDVQEPRAVLVVRHADARIARDHVVVNRQDGRLLEVHPRHLGNIETRLVLWPHESRTNRTGRERAILFFLFGM